MAPPASSGRPGPAPTASSGRPGPALTASPGRPGLARADPDDVNRLDFNGAVSARLKGWKNHVTLYSWDYYYLIAPAVSEKGMFIIKRDCGASCN